MSRVCVFTSNQPRHVALLDALVDAGHDVVAVIEPKTMLLPESGVMREYWTRVRDAERVVFRDTSPMVCVPALVLRPGELSRAPWLPAQAQHLVVFSASYITGALADAMIEKGAINLHVGIAPEYRGSAPNAFAMADGRPDLIGAQVQRLSKGLDAGDILAEVRPGPEGDYFTRSMLAVNLGIAALVALLETPEPWTPVCANDRAQQLRYSRHSDFTEAVAAKILGVPVPPCPCCGSSAAPVFDGRCSLCHRAPLHKQCGRCWDHCLCNPHPLRGPIA